MASKTSIPRFLLPQYGAIWRTTTRTSPFSRPLNADLGQVMVRYASKTATTSKVAKSTTTISKTAAAKKVEAPKAASTKAAASKATPAKAASTRVSPPKTAPAKTPATKAPAPKSATPKTPTSQPAAKATIAAASKPTVLKTATTPDPSKPIVLEKPERFNPPSHGARLPRSTPKHYGGATTFEEVQVQKTREYPGLPPPDNTWAHWFLHNRHIHMFITLGTLVSLAVYSFTSKFNAESPYADMIPPISEFPSHPIDYIGTCLHVLRLHEEHISAITAEKRRRKVEDVAKRKEYRKAHGLDSAQGIESWTGSSKSSGDPATASAEDEAQPQPASPEDIGITEDGKRKKFLGIF